MDQRDDHVVLWHHLDMQDGLAIVMHGDDLFRDTAQDLLTKGFQRVFKEPGLQVEVRLVDLKEGRLLLLTLRGFDVDDGCRFIGTREINAESLKLAVINICADILITGERQMPAESRATWEEATRLATEIGVFP